ncbi:MAG: dockerin type I repeat-containing protein [Clostridia bacterium]|nr:dockerin type I repeat-containing protein [Clostridia bacterium]
MKKIASVLAVLLTLSAFFAAVPALAVDTDRIGSALSEYDEVQHISADEAPDPAYVPIGDRIGGLADDDGDKLFRKSLKEHGTGDIDGDGRVDSLDARGALRAAAKLERLSGDRADAADVNYDLLVTSADARMILRHAARIEELPFIWNLVFSKTEEILAEAGETIEIGPLRADRIRVTVDGKAPEAVDGMRVSSETVGTEPVGEDDPIPGEYFSFTASAVGEYFVKIELSNDPPGHAYEPIEFTFRCAGPDAYESDIAAVLIGVRTSDKTEMLQKEAYSFTDENGETLSPARYIEDIECIFDGRKVLTKDDVSDEDLAAFPDLGKLIEVGEPMSILKIGLSSEGKARIDGIIKALEQNGKVIYAEKDVLIKAADAFLSVPADGAD